MGKKATPPRSFNTIRRSQTKVRAQRRRTQNVLLLAMFATVALILVTLLVLGGFMIANTIIDARPAPDNSDNNTPSANTITFVQTTKSSGAIHSGTLILVNKDYKYTFPIGVMLDDISENAAKKADNSTTIYGPVPGVELLEQETLQALNSMMYKYDELFGDTKFAVSSAYRTEAAQGALGSNVKPGESEHHTGYCVALQVGDPGGNDRKNLDPDTDRWFYQNCYKFGFVVRYPEEKANITGVSRYKHCFRYVGVAHATYMHQNNLCLEEYLDLLKSSYSSAATRLTISAADGFDYDVYYVAASGAEVTTIDVPTSDFAYTVSGDNRGGYIVTVKKPVPAA